MKLRKSGVIPAGLALFSMFFGAGDLIWPLILGGEMGDKNMYAVAGLLITGVTLPLLGLMAMMLFRGDYRAFFGQIGHRPGLILLFLIQAILGPFGSTPRLLTLAYATLKPYLPALITFPWFCVSAILVLFFFITKRHRVVDILGMLLSPILLIALGLIVVLGFLHPPAAESLAVSGRDAFFRGLQVGYNTLDLIASFIFAPLVLSYFHYEEKEQDALQARRNIFKKMTKSCILAGGLLAAMYLSLTYLSSFYTPVMPAHAPEERLAALSLYLLGPKGAFCSCLAVFLTCLTTAIPISIISSEYIQKQFMRQSKSPIPSILVALLLSALVANLGFMGIARMLSPILQIICPGLILLCIFGILHKLYEMRMRRVPVFATFALSLFGYLTQL